VDNVGTQPFRRGVDIADFAGTTTRQHSPEVGGGQCVALAGPGMAVRALCGWVPACAYQKAFLVREIVALGCDNHSPIGPSDQVFCLIRFVSSAIWL
jgi:hypothetical protein